MTFEEYEKTVPAFVPRGAISWLVGRLHVSVTDDLVAEDIRKRLAKNLHATEEQIRECIYYALACHHENQKLYREVMTGRFS